MAVRNGRGAEKGPAARRSAPAAATGGDQARKRPVITMGWDDFDEPDVAPRLEPQRDYKRSRWRRRDFLKFAVFFAVIVSLVGGGLYYVVRPAVVHGIVDWAAENPTALHIPWVAGLVRSELHNAIVTPVDAGDTSSHAFTVTPGDTPKEIAQRLVKLSLISDERAFVFRSIERGLTGGFIADDYTLNKSMTVDQIITLLTTPKPTPPTVRVTFKEGDRIEQMAAVLEIKEANPDDASVVLQMDVKQFYQLATHPPADLVAEFPWLKLPTGASLEGFLFPDTYVVGPDIAPRDFIERMLRNFRAKAPAGLFAMSPTEMYQTVQVASIVEKEAAVDFERPIIAGVYVNRLNIKLWPTKLLEADPTVKYANDGVWLSEPGHPMETWIQYIFWGNIGTADYGKLTFAKPWDVYNSYTHKGLPPTPICSPGAASLQGALTPDIADGYLYFVAKNDGSKTHAFARTLAEHEANLQLYGY